MGELIRIQFGTSAMPEEPLSSPVVNGNIAYMQGVESVFIQEQDEGPAYLRACAAADAATLRFRLGIEAAKAENNEHLSTIRPQ
ncbi:MAG TPA: hypothetical protein VM124_03505 [Candidatus Limnocylindrales bacterium]|nr:hypothetical protein [Candidatus Limnocylindrales bacterium]